MLEEHPVRSRKQLVELEPGSPAGLRFDTRDFELSGGDETMSERWSAQQEALSVLPRYCSMPRAQSEETLRSDLTLWFPALAVVAGRQFLS